jgi:hypothetical protein
VARFSLPIRSFNSGELSPEVLGRADINKFNSGAKVLENFIVHPEGGAFRRPGTRHVRIAHTPQARTRVVTFVFSTTQAYILELSNQRMRVYANEGIVLAPEISGIPPSAVEPALAPFGHADGPSQWRITDHGFHYGMPIRFSNDGGALPVDDATGLPLDPSTTYYVITPQAYQFGSADWNIAAINSIDIANHGYSLDMGPFRFRALDGSIAGGLRSERNILDERYWIAVGADFDPAAIFSVSTAPGGPIATIVDAGRTSPPSVLMIEPDRDYARDTFRLSSTDPIAGAETLVRLRDSGTGTHTATPFPGPTQADALVLEIETPWLSAELEALQFVQSADVLYVIHPNHRPTKISRRGNTAWSIDPIEFIDGPYLPENVTETSVTVNTTDPARRALTFSSPEGINGGDGFGAADVGRLIRFLVASGANRQFQWGVIAGVGDNVTIDFEPLNDPPLAGTGATTLWSLGSFRKGSLDVDGLIPPNYPAAVTFFEQRFVLGGEPETPQTIHMSKSGDFESFSPTGARPLNTVGDGSAGEENQSLLEEVLDDNAIDFQIGANQVNSILWFAGGRSLLVGTPGGVYPVRASSSSEAVTPSNVNVSQASVLGVGAVQAVPIANRVVYMSRNQRQILALRFAFETDDFVADDLTILADHILGRAKSADQGVTEMAYQAERHSILWAVRRDGQLLGCTYVPDQEVFAWHRHIMGGSFSGGIAEVESIASIPSPNATYDQLWMVVKRTIGGVETRHIDFMLPMWDVDDDLNFTVEEAEPEPIYVDSSPVPYNGVALQETLVGDGVGGSFPTTFVFGLEEDVLVRRLDAAGVVTTLTNGVDYSVTGGSKDADPTTWVTGAIVTLDLSKFQVGDTWFLDRITPLPVLVVPAFPETGVAITPPNGLDHLIGETVQVFAEQGVHPDRVVDGIGQITLAQAHKQIVAGLQYVSDYVSVPLEVPDPQGASMGKAGRFDTIFMRLLLTIGGKISGDGVTFDPIVMRAGHDPMDVGLTQDHTA